MNNLYIGLIVLFIAIVGVKGYLFVQNSDNTVNNLIKNSSFENISHNGSNNSSINSDIIENKIVFTTHIGKTDKNSVTITVNCQKSVYQGTNATLI